MAKRKKAGEEITGHTDAELVSIFDPLTAQILTSMCDALWELKIRLEAIEAVVHDNPAFTDDQATGQVHESGLDLNLCRNLDQQTPPPG